MTASPFNSPLEIATRIVLILAERPNVPRGERALAAIDLLTTNRGDFSSRGINLHGHAMIRASLASRMSLIQRAIPFAVTRGLIVPDAQGGAICYTATEQGRRFVDNLDSQYVRDYKTMLTSTLAFVDSHAINDVLAMLDGRYPLTEGGIQ